MPRPSLTARFHENVEALKSVQPADLPATEIDVRLGASWLPPEDVQQFIQELLGVSSGVEIGHIHALGTWHVNAGWEARSATANTTDWGTDRYTALELIEDALNLKTPTVYDLDEKEAGRQRPGHRGRARETGTHQGTVQGMGLAG